MRSTHMGVGVCWVGVGCCWWALGVVSGEGVGAVWVGVIGVIGVVGMELGEMTLWQNDHVYM